MSRYMNSTPRVKGWTLIDSLLDSWADNFYSDQQKTTDQLAQKKRAEKANFYQYETSEQYYIVPSVIILSKPEQSKDNSWSLELQCELNSIADGEVAFDSQYWPADCTPYFHDTNNAENESFFSPYSEDKNFHSLYY